MKRKAKNKEMPIPVVRHFAASSASKIVLKTKILCRVYLHDQSEIIARGQNNVIGNKAK